MFKGPQLKARREELGLSTMDLAHYCGVSIANLEAIEACSEASNYPVYLEQIKLIAHELGLT